MNILRKFALFLITIVLVISPVGLLFAADTDFTISNNTEIKYSTGDDYVNVETEYIREVNNKKYYYPAQGEKIFHIPDLPQSKDYEIELERQFKKDSLSVKDNNGNSVKYSIEDLDLGQGLYIKVGNYKQTVYGSDYRIVLRYKTHDLVRKINDFVSIQAPALPEDISFEQVDEGSKTKTVFTYDLSIVTDSNIPALSHSYPSGYTVSKDKDLTYYNFPSKLRINQSPTLEFGTEQIFRFELSYKTPKTDNFIPERYSEVFKALSTNIFELSLPRDFAENNQRVKIEEIFPTPKRIYKDSEGNIIATFEVDANKESVISVSGYIWVEQNPLSDPMVIPNPDFESYKKDVLASTYGNTYLGDSKYWEVSDSFIQEEAKRLVGDSKYLLDIVANDYAYVNEKLEYDESKVNSGNDRIGARAALSGGGSVCMEYADSMIAILRAQGIPARAALGYANLDILEKTGEDSNIRHQWVQIWVPEYGWLSIDPTYESKNMEIGQDISRVLWETFNGDDLSNIRVYSADNLAALNALDYKIKIFAVKEEDVKSDLLDYSDILPLQEGYTATAFDTVNTFVKTTSLGKALVIVAPILVIIFVLILLLALINILIRKLRTRKGSQVRNS